MRIAHIALFSGPTIVSIVVSLLLFPLLVPALCAIPDALLWFRNHCRGAAVSIGCFGRPAAEPHVLVLSALALPYLLLSAAPVPLLCLLVVRASIPLWHLAFASLAGACCMGCVNWSRIQMDDFPHGDCCACTRLDASCCACCAPLCFVLSQPFLIAPVSCRRYLAPCEHRPSCPSQADH